MIDPERQDKEKAALLPWTSSALVMLVAAALSLPASARLHAQSLSESLPDAPSALLFTAHDFAKSNPLWIDAQNTSQSDVQNAPQNPSTVLPSPANSLPPCPKAAHKGRVPIIFLPSTKPSCQDPLQLIVDTGHVSPLTSRQKATLATRDITDPFNLLTIGFFSAITVAANAHTAYGPGFAGWGRESGYSLAEDIQGEVTGTFVIPSLAHEDPRYHRMPGAPISRRIEHALIHTLISQHDNGSLMPNYATLINYPLSAEISNLYVPNLATNVPSTAKRVLAGYATDPIGPLLAEFLPDFAKRVHIHVVFAQQILNHMATGSGEGASSF
jgi:hypothetical protein